MVDRGLLRDRWRRAAVASALAALAAAGSAAADEPGQAVSLAALLKAPGEAAGGARTPVSLPGYGFTCSKAAGATSTDTDCRFARRYGAVTIAPTLSLDGALRIDHLRFDVDGDQVRSVRFEASLDEYDPMLRLLTQRLGPPAITRGTLRTPVGDRDSVQATWRSPQALVKLAAPALPGLDMRVTITAPQRSPAPNRA